MNFKILFLVTIVALCLSTGDSLFIKKKLLLGKLALKSKVAGILGAKAKLLGVVPKLAVKGAVAKAGIAKLGLAKLGVAKVGLKGVPLIAGVSHIGGLSHIGGVSHIGGLEQDHQSFEYSENPILIPHPEPLVEHIYAPPPPPQVFIPPPSPQVILQHHEPAPVYTEISSVPVSVPIEIEEKADDGPSYLSSALDSIKETAAAYNPLRLFSSEESHDDVGLDYKFVPSYGFSHYKKVNYLPVVPTQVIHAPPPPPTIVTVPQPPTYIPQPSPPTYIPSPPSYIPSPSIPSIPTGPYAPPPPPPPPPSGPYPPSS